MTRTELIMGMPITIVIPDREGADGLPDARNTNPGAGYSPPGARNTRPGARYPTLSQAADALFDYFKNVDLRFSPFKPESETSRIDRGELDPAEASPEMKEVLGLSEETRRLTEGYFNVWFNGRFDPSGLVKGWAINNAARMLDDDGFISFCVEAGGDIEVRGANHQGAPWAIGIRNPFDTSTLIRSLAMHGGGIATSGTYIRGEHIYNPLTGGRANEIASITVIGPNVYEADRMATAAFAMGARGIEFVAGLPDFDAYMVEKNGMATFTPGFARYMT